MKLHLSTPGDWINDPLGLTWRPSEGRYHLFFQAVPDSEVWQPGCHWGHATSADLLTWVTHPTALSPGEDDDGCWSGDAALLPDDSGLIVYSSIKEEQLDLARIRIARSTDWHTWSKGEVIVPGPPEAGVRMFRDPVLNRVSDGWQLLIGGGYADGRPVVFRWHCASDDADDLGSADCWDYRGPFVIGAANKSIGAGWECPQLIDIDGTPVMVCSVWTPSGTDVVIAAAGELRDREFVPGAWVPLTMRGEGQAYAAATFADSAGDPSVIFWLRGPGCLSAPYSLRLHAGRPVLDWHPSVSAYVDGDQLQDGSVVERLCDGVLQVLPTC